MSAATGTTGTTTARSSPRRAPHGELAAGLGRCDELSLPLIAPVQEHHQHPALRQPPAEHSSPLITV